MTTEKRNIIWGITAIAILSLVVIYFIFKNFSLDTKEPLDAIVPETPLIVKINSLDQLHESLLIKADFWSSLNNNNLSRAFAQKMHQLDSLAAKYPEVNELFTSRPVYLFLLPQKQDSVPIVMMVTSIDQLFNERKVHKIIDELTGKNLSDKASGVSDNIFYVDSLLFYTVSNGLFIAGNTHKGVNQALHQLSKGDHIKLDKFYSRLSLTEGEYAEVNLYIKFDAVTPLIEKWLSESHDEIGAFVQRIGEWSEIDVKIKNQEILFNGFANYDSSNLQLFNYLAYEPAEISVPGILPYNTHLLIDFSYQDFMSFYKGLAAFNENSTNADATSKIENINKAYGIDVENDFLSWIDSELAIASATDNNTGKNSQYVILGIDDEADAIRGLHKITQKMDKNGSAGFLDDYQDYVIHRIGSRDFLGTLFGNLFSAVKSPYYVIFKDYVVFANTVPDLKNLISTYFMNKTLADNSNYQFFSDNVFESSNFYFYCNIRKSLPTIGSWFNEDIRKYLLDNEAALINFEGFGLQLSHSNNMFFTNMYLKYNAAYQEEHINNWEVTLDAPIVRKPYLVKNHRDKRLNIIAFDELNSMYLIDHTGIIRWKIPVLELPVSDIMLMDYYTNNKWQYMFNTENYLYLIDLEGNPVAGYPVNLMVKAASPVAVFDYEKDKDYRILIGLDDQKVYNFEKDGSRVDGWYKFKTSSNLAKKPQHFLLRGKDYLIFTDVEGKPTITNRRGEIRIPVDPGFRQAKNSIFYINLTNSAKGLFLTTDQQGKLVYIASSGKIKTTDFGSFSPEHFFLYEDFNGDDDRDFIFIDKNQLMVFNRFGEKILSAEFKQEITISPTLFRDHANHPYLAIVEDSISQVSIYDKNGPCFTGHAYFGSTACVAGEINTDEKTNLIIGADNKIYNYILE